MGGQGDPDGMTSRRGTRPSPGGYGLCHFDYSVGWVVSTAIMEESGIIKKEAMCSDMPFIMVVNNVASYFNKLHSTFEIATEQN